MQEVDPDETRTRELMWLTERVTTLGKEKAAMETALREMDEKIALQEDFANNVADRRVSLEEAIKSIAEHIQRLCVFNECVKTTLGGLVEEVKTHQGHFQEVVRFFVTTSSTSPILVLRLKIWRNTSTPWSKKTRRKGPG